MRKKALANVEVFADKNYFTLCEDTKNILLEV